MRNPSRALLFGGVAAAAFLAGAGAFLFFTTVPEVGSAREQAIVVPEMKQADIDRIIAERKARAPRPSAIASVEERITTDELRAEGQFANLPGGDDLTPAAEGNQGDELFAEGHYDEAIAFWRTQAEAGDRWSAYRLGKEYLRGDPAILPKDVPQGARWIRLAAIKNEPHAQYVFGRLHETGEGVEADSAQAASWFLKSAQRGVREAQFAIAPRLRDGNGVARDPVEALKFYILASHPGGGTGAADDEAAAVGTAADAAASATVPVVKPETALRAALSKEDVAEAERRAAAFRPIRD